jgi:topoisomerase-4 subunit A
MHGNYGSIDNDPVAAMRYTETRLGTISEYLLKDIEKGIVPFAPNFDDTEMEPTVLPARFPNLLVNGASGIASGYSTTIPPHNLNEIIKALIFVHQNEEVRLSDLTKIVKGPDYPTGGIASSTKSIKEIYKTGKGKVTIRAKMEYNPSKSEIYITELPFEVVKGDLVRKLDEQIREGKIPALKEVRDDSDRKGLQITIKTQKDID